MKEMSLEEGVNILNAFRAKRAFDAGYQARLKGTSKDAIPPEMHVFSGKWVEGWWAAEMDLIPAPDLVLPSSVMRVRNSQPLPALTVCPPVEEMLPC